jgi:flagellar biosynthesis protein FliR
MALLEVEIFKVFLLAFVRFSGLLVAAPVLGSNNIPARVKAGLAAMSALLITPVIPALTETLPSEPIIFATYAVGELMIGLILGFVMTIVFAAIQVGGQIMDMQTGFGLINVFNPALETQVPIFGFFFFLLAVLYLLVIDGHHEMIRALAYSFRHIPLGGFTVNPAMLRDISTMGSAMFYDGLIIAAPVAAAMMLSYATMGLMSRVVPQIHLFVVGFPVTIALGLLLVAFIIQIYLLVLKGMYNQMFEQVYGLIRRMA